MVEPARCRLMAAVAAALLALAGCRPSPVAAPTTHACEPETVLARLGGVEIRGAEVAVQRARLVMAGGEASSGEALREVVWQEAERQRRGLPPTPTLEAARRLVVRQVRAERLRARSAPQLDPRALPERVELTPCGQNALAEAHGPAVSRSP